MRRFSIVLSFLFFLSPFSLATSLGPLTLAHSLSTQFPPVARVDQPFSWTFSADTFSSSSSSSSSTQDSDNSNVTEPASDSQLNLGYTAFNLPSWLAFSGTTRTFAGRPTINDLGPRVIQLTATTPDGQSSISDHVTLFVSDKEGNITLTHPIVDQLHAKNTDSNSDSDSDFGSGSITSAFPYGPSSAHYPGVRVPPDWSFSLGFTPSTFTAPTRVFYSASLLDGSPLPGWLGFNNQTVTFDGVTPKEDEGGLHQIALSGSDIFGYSDIQETFSIVISAHDLQVVQQPLVNMTIGFSADVSIKNVIRQSLSLDGEEGKISSPDLTEIQVDTSSVSWLSYSSQNISLTGTPPDKQTALSLPLGVIDKYGGVVNSTLTLAFYPSLFLSDRPDTIPVDLGKSTTIQMAQYLVSGVSSADHPINLTASFDPKEAGSWLSLSSDQKSLQGTPPSDLKYDQITISLRAQDLTTNAFSRSILSLSMDDSNTLSSHPRPQTPMRGLSKGTKMALGIVCSLVGVLIILFALVALRRRRSSSLRKQIGEDTDVPEFGPGEGKWSYEAAETPALEYTEKMGGDPATTQMLVLGRIEEGSHSNETVVASVPHLRMGSACTTATGTVSGTAQSRLKKNFLSNPFARGNKRVIPKISNPIIMPSLSNAAFQAQLAAAVDSAGIVKRGDTTYSTHSELTHDNDLGGYDDDDEESADFTATPSFLSGSQGDRSRAGSKASQRSDISGGSGEFGFRSDSGARTTITDESGSAFGAGQSSRASWESEPPFVWTITDTPHGHNVSNISGSREGSVRTGSSPSSMTHQTSHSSRSQSRSENQHDPHAPTQRADFKVTSIPMPSSRATSPHGSMATASTATDVSISDEGISIDNIHFPTDSDLAHTETSSASGDDPHAVAVIQTASRIDARRTLDSPAAPSMASSHTERGGVGAVPSPVMTTHSRLVSFGKQRKVEVEEGKGSMSHSAVIEAGSIGLGIGVGMGMSSLHMPPRRQGSSPSPPPESPLPPPPRAVTRPSQRTPVQPPTGSMGSIGGSSRSSTPPSSLPSLPALPTQPSTTSTASRSGAKKRTGATSPLASPQRILLGVSEPFHFYPPLSISPSTSSSSTSSVSTTTTGRKANSAEGAEYLAYVETRISTSASASASDSNPNLVRGARSTTETYAVRLGTLPDWLHFEDGELWGVPTDSDRGEVNLRIVERRSGEERVVGRFALEVVGR